jgi:hypothetical protein
MRDHRFIAQHRGGPLIRPHHFLLSAWAADCAEHALSLFAAHSSHDRPRVAIATARTWANLAQHGRPMRFRRIQLDFRPCKCVRHRIADARPPRFRPGRPIFCAPASHQRVDRAAPFAATRIARAVEPGRMVIFPRSFYPGAERAEKELGIKRTGRNCTAAAVERLALPRFESHASVGSRAGPRPWRVAGGSGPAARTKCSAVTRDRRKAMSRSPRMTAPLLTSGSARRNRGKSTRWLTTGASFVLTSSRHFRGRLPSVSDLSIQDAFTTKPIESPEISSMAMKAKPRGLRFA